MSVLPLLPRSALARPIPVSLPASMPVSIPVPLGMLQAWFMCGYGLGLISVASTFLNDPGAGLDQYVIRLVGVPMLFGLYGCCGLTLDRWQKHPLSYPDWFWYVYPLAADARMAKSIIQGVCQATAILRL
jgi:hypothetical protein